MWWTERKLIYLSFTSIFFLPPTFSTHMTLQADNTKKQINARDGTNHTTLLQVSHFLFLCLGEQNFYFFLLLSHTAHCVCCSVLHHLQSMINTSTWGKAPSVWQTIVNDRVSILKTDVVLFNRWYPSQMTTRYSITQVNTNIAEWNVKLFLL